MSQGHPFLRELSPGPLPLNLSPPPPALPLDRVVLIADASALPPGPWLPVFASAVSAGFPSVFFCRAEGWSMRDDGIHDGDVLVVDRAITPTTGMIVVAAVCGELTVKRFVQRGQRPMLLAANPEYAAIELREGEELHVWGVVTSSVRFHLPHAKGLRVVAA